MCECLDYDDGSRHTCEACVGDLEYIRAQRDRYEAALRFYADRQTYGLNGGDSNWIFSDTGKRARAALAGGGEK